MPSMSELSLSCVRCRADVSTKCSPSCEEDAQKPLWDEYKNARAQGKPAYFVRAKLFVDGKPWSSGDA